MKAPEFQIENQRVLIMMKRGQSCQAKERQTSPPRTLRISPVDRWLAQGNEIVESKLIIYNAFNKHLTGKLGTISHTYLD